MFDFLRKEEDFENWEERRKEVEIRTKLEFELTAIGQTALTLLESVEKLTLEDHCLINLLTELRKPEKELTANVTREALKELIGKYSSASQLLRTLLSLIPYDNPNTTSPQYQLFLIEGKRTILPKTEE